MADSSSNSLAWEIKVWTEFSGNLRLAPGSARARWCGQNKQFSSLHLFVTLFTGPWNFQVCNDNELSLQLRHWHHFAKENSLKIASMTIPAPAPTDWRCKKSLAKANTFLENQSRLSWSCASDRSCPGSLKILWAGMSVSPRFFIKVEVSCKMFQIEELRFPRLDYFF